MELYQLELFLTVVKSGSLTQASKDRGLSVGALSQQLQRLSSDIGFPLFVKSGRGLALTAHGRQLADRARRVLEEVDALRQSFSADAESDTKPFHLASGATTLIHAVGRHLRVLRRRYPRASLRITAANTEEMVEGLLKHRFDLAIISLPVLEDRLNLHPIYEEELLLLRPVDKPLKGWRVGQIPASELGELPFLLYPPESNMRQLIDAGFRGINFVPRVNMEAADTEVIVRLVEAGFGQSFLPANALRRSPRYFKVLRVEGLRIVRQQAIATLRGAEQRPLTSAITRFFIDSLQ